MPAHRPAAGTQPAHCPRRGAAGARHFLRRPVQAPNVPLGARREPRALGWLKWFSGLELLLRRSGVRTAGGQAMGT